MPQTIAQLVAVFLLLVQGLAAFGPGRVLCVPTDDYWAHESAHGGAHAADHGDCDHHDHGPAPCNSVGSARGCDDHGHALVLALLHIHEDCGCHVHVPIRSDDTTPITPRDRGVDARAIFTPVVVALLTNWDWASAWVRTAEGHPPDSGASVQLRALKSTRLRI